jgi:hypothetical protein
MANTPALGRLHHMTTLFSGIGTRENETLGVERDS